MYFIVEYIELCSIIRCFVVQEDLVNKIKYMGALFSSKLVGGTTHVVAKNVLSVKYEVSLSVVLCCRSSSVNSEIPMPYFSQGLWIWFLQRREPHMESTLEISFLDNRNWILHFKNHKLKTLHWIPVYKETYDIAFWWLTTRYWSMCYCITSNFAVCEFLLN